MPDCRTVGELMKFLGEFPEDMPIFNGARHVHAQAATAVRGPHEGRKVLYLTFADRAELVGALRKSENAMTKNIQRWGDKDESVLADAIQEVRTALARCSHDDSALAKTEADKVELSWWVAELADVLENYSRIKGFEAPEIANARAALARWNKTAENKEAGHADRGRSPGAY